MCAKRHAIRHKVRLCTQSADLCVAKEDKRFLAYAMQPLVSSEYLHSCPRSLREEVMLANLGVCGKCQGHIDHVAKVRLQILIGLCDSEVQGSVCDVAQHLSVGNLQQ